MWSSLLEEIAVKIEAYPIKKETTILAERTIQQCIQISKKLPEEVKNRLTGETALVHATDQMRGA